jgi:hypothetical protein
MTPQHVLIVCGAVGAMFAAGPLRRHVRALFASIRLDDELNGLMNRAVTERVQEKLQAGSLLVHAHVGSHLLGSFLEIDLDAIRLHLRLYRCGRAPDSYETESPRVRLHALTFVDDRGWLVVFETPRGEQRYLGWLIEVRSPVVSPAPVRPD